MGLPWCGLVDANERIHRKVPKLQGDLGKDFVGKDVGRLDKRQEPWVEIYQSTPIL